MSAHAIAQLLKQQISLLDYLVSQAWRPAKAHRPRPTDGTVPAPLRAQAEFSGRSRQEPCSTVMDAVAAAM